MPANGQLDTRTLTHIGDGLYLTDSAARSWFAVREDLAEETHINPIISKPDGAYRDLAGQRRQKDIAIAAGRPNDASVPGYSTHGWGNAVDINNISRYPQATIDRIMAGHGFTRTIPRESWHYVHDGSTPAGGGSTPIGDELTPEQAQQLAAVYAALWNGGTNIVDGVLMKYSYGVLHLEVANQQLIARLIAGQAALQATVNALATGAGLDPEALSALIASKIEAALADDFAGVKAAIPTEFTITSNS